MKNPDKLSPREMRDEIRILRMKTAGTPLIEKLQAEITRLEKLIPDDTCGYCGAKGKEPCGG